MDNNLIIFVKYPHLGKVKTRIGKIIGNEKAAELYSSLVLHIINKLLNSDHFKISIAFTPSREEHLIKKWINNSAVDYFPQRGRTLGEKISNAFNYSFSNGHQKTIVIGSDCIEFDQQTIKTAFDHLNKADCVVGPTYDGGYYLIGLRYKNFPYIFEDIAWSSNSVFDQTMLNIHFLKLQCIVLNKLNDVDRVEDIDDKVMSLLQETPSVRSGYK